MVQEGTASPLVDVSSYVPQGSTLDSLFFPRSAIPLLSAPSLLIHMYADDTVLYKPIFCARIRYGGVDEVKPSAAECGEDEDGPLKDMSSPSRITPDRLNIN